MTCRVWAAVALLGAAALADVDIYVNGSYEGRVEEDGDVTSTLPLKKYGGLAGNSYKGRAGEGNNAIHISVVKGSVDVSTGPE